MDLARLAAAHPGLALDLLKVWVSEARCRTVAPVASPGCPWESLTVALRSAFEGRLTTARVAELLGVPFSAEALEGPPGELSERLLREVLVHTYMQQTPEATQAILEAKREDSLSFFCAAKYGSLEEAWAHWPWYLYCLTFEVGGCDGGDARVAAVPLDTVDLQVIAGAFRTQITVTYFMEEARRFTPPRGAPPAERSAHLLCDPVSGLWAPLTGPRKREDEMVDLVGAVVELGKIDAAPLKHLSHRHAVVSSYNPQGDLYWVYVDSLLFPVERAQIKRPLFHERDPWRWEEPRHAETFRGIPDGALEFHVLHELVRRESRARLATMVHELSGRGRTGPCAAARRARLASRFGPLPPPASSNAATQAAHGQCRSAA